MFELYGWEIHEFQANNGCDCGEISQTYNICSGHGHTWTVAAWRRCHACVHEFTSTNRPVR